MSTRDEDDVCGNCGGEGYVAMCHTDYECVDPESGCDLCMRRCDWCNSGKPPHVVALPSPVSVTEDDGA